MKANKLFILGLLLSTLVYTGCDNKEESTTNDEFSFGESVSRDFQGKIVDSNNNPLSNVAIEMSGRTTSTDSNGEFTLTNVNVREHFGYLTATKAGFINGSRTVFPHEGMNKVTIMMLPNAVYATIPSGQTTAVTLPNNTKVTFDGAFMLLNGNSYTGNVKVVVNHLDAADPYVFQKMPGNLIGTRTNGTTSGMETYGMINVELRGTNNEKLQLMTGHTANLSMPIAPNQLDTAEDTIPLWYFNETSGLWEEQGFSRKVGNKYIGNVSHFTWWNNDSAYVVATLNVVVTNVDTTPVNGVRITITRQAGSTGDVLMDLGFTGPNGRLSAGVPRNEVLIFRAYLPNGTLVSTQTLPASNLLTRTVYVVIPVNDRISNTAIKG
jgi:hypothetical protein